MTDYRVGDEVTLTEHTWGGQFEGRTGVIIQVDPGVPEVPYKVQIDGDTEYPGGRWVRVEGVPNAPHQTRTAVINDLETDIMNAPTSDPRDLAEHLYARGWRN